MIDKNMIALAEIRNGYTLPKYGNLTFEQNLLIKYDNLCLKLIEENQKYKEIIDKIKHILNNQMNYREFVDIVNAIEEVIKEVE